MFTNKKRLIISYFEHHLLGGLRHNCHNLGEAFCYQKSQEKIAT